MAVNQQRRAAKLSKARSKAKERRKQRDPHPSSSAQVLGNFGGFSGLDLSKSEIITDASERFGTRKMSEVLYELIEPMNPDDLDPEKVLTFAKLGAMAWNLALMPEEQCVKMFDEAVKGLPPNGDRMLLALISRKLKLFPDDKRFILGVEMKYDGTGGCTLLAMTSIPPSDQTNTRD